jgi:1,4-dihydroxy-2-naphthoyl-CoA synthase
MEVNDFRDIKYEKDEQTGIVLLTLNTPKRKNAMSPCSKPSPKPWTGRTKA